MNRITMNALAVALAFCGMGATSAMAEAAPVGYVKNVTGEVRLIGGGASLRAVVGSPVAAGSTLKTAENASVGVSLRDSTLISLGPNSEFVFRDFAFEPGEGKLSLLARLTRGTLDYVSGVIAKLRPEAVALETPSGTLAVRGTHFAVKVDDE
jgi:hypothetical protein